VAAFLESIDVNTVPFVSVTVKSEPNYLVLSFESVAGVTYGIESRDVISGPTMIVAIAPGNGQRLDVPLPVVSGVRLYRLIQYP
jgi:hypothetical protein